MDNNEGSSGVGESDINNLLWSRSLQDMPVFSLNNIEKHGQLSGKSKGLPISKTLKRGQQFMEEGYVKFSTIYTSRHNNCFLVKCKCQASIKAELRNMMVDLSMSNGDVTLG